MAHPQRSRRLSALSAVTVLAAALASFTVPSVMTAPAAQAAQAPTSVTFGVSGDHSTGVRPAAVFRAVGANKPDFFLSMGDLSYKPSAEMSEKAWCQMVKDNINAGAGKPAKDAFGEQYPVMLLSGNHESGGNGLQHGLIDNFAAQDCLPDRLDTKLSPNTGTNNTAPRGNYGKEMYVDLPQGKPLMRMIAVSPGMTFTHGGSYEITAGNPRYQWLSETIDAARATGIRWIVVAIHANYISVGKQGNGIGADVMNLLLQKKVDLVLQGHDHGYQRSKQLVSGTPQCPVLSDTTNPPNLACTTGDGADGKYTRGMGTVLTINGNGGAIMYPVTGADPHAPLFASYMKTPGGDTENVGNWGYMKVTVTDKALSGELVRAYGTLDYQDKFVIGDDSDTTAPSPPTSVRAKATSATGVDVSWAAATDNVGVKEYRVLRDGQQIATVPAPGLTHRDVTATASTTYRYTVTAVDAAGNTSAPSTVATVTTPAGQTPPTSLTILAAADASVASATPNTLRGRESSLLVDSSPRTDTLMRFNLNGVAGKKITGAKLRLLTNNPTDAGGNVFLTGATNLVDGQVTWRNAPATTGASIARFGAAARDVWVEVPIPVSALTGRTSVVLRQVPTSSDGFGFYSRESGKPPQLVVTTG